MTDPYLFGQPINFDVYPTKLNEDLSAREVAGMTLVSAYLFPDTIGTVTAAQGTSGTGAIQGPVSSWTANDGGYTIAFAAVDDPYPTSTIDVRVYFVTVNVQLSGGAQVQTIILPLVLRRVHAHHTRVETSPIDLEDHYPNVGSYFTATRQETLIRIAKEEVQQELEGKFLVWLRIDRLDQLNRSVALKALSNGFLSLIKERGDQWSILYAEYKQKYGNAIATQRLDYDSDQDGIPDTQATAKPNFAWINLFDKPTSRNREP